MWTTVDVFGLMLHCCVPPVSMKWFSKEKRTVFPLCHPLISFSPFVCQSFLAPILLVPLSVVDGAWWSGVENGSEERHQKCS